MDDETEQWVVRMTNENSDWGYDRIVGAMANLGYTLSGQTVGNIQHRYGIPTRARAQAYDNVDRLYPWAHVCPRRD
jgi:hypothetical protein